MALGYASLDHKFATADFQGPGHTTLVRTRLTEAGPEPGAVSYFASALARHGHDAGIVTWAASDDMGQRFRAELLRRGVDVTGLSLSGTRSPSTLLFYPDGGESVVWFDRGDVDQTLTGAQAEVIAGADAVVVGIGPSEATARALDVIRPEALVLWSVKADAASMPRALAHRLAARADVICHSTCERAFLESECALELEALAQTGTIVVTTRGSAGAQGLLGDATVDVPGMDAVDVVDTTGAGDTFAGSLLARLMRLHADPISTIDAHDLHDAIAGAGKDAGCLLRSRTKGQHD